MTGSSRTRGFPFACGGNGGGAIQDPGLSCPNTPESLSSGTPVAIEPAEPVEKLLAALVTERLEDLGMSKVLGSAATLAGIGEGDGRREGETSV